MSDLLDDVMGYPLDSEQREVVYSSEKHVLVVAGAGSGKSLTIIGKIRYLIEEKHLLPEEILCISFTRESASSLSKKLRDYYNYNLDVYTFHKLGLEIIKESSPDLVNIAPSDYLEYVINEYFLGIVFENIWMMKCILRYFHVSYLFQDVENKYLKFIEMDTVQFRNFKQLLNRFLKLFKSSGYKSSKFYEFFLENSSSFGFRNKIRHNLFFQIAFSIYTFYEQELASSGLVDFDDMILKSTELVCESFNKKYRYIIIDEYQDTSYTRFLLIQSILNKTDANLLVVGDDFQSIYQFTGCNLDMFLNFKDFFPDSKTYKITNTYRNSQELVTIAGNFIMKNPRQIKKQLKSSKTLSSPIEIYYTDNPKCLLLKLINFLPDGSILILGRNNFDIYPYLDSTMELLSDGTVVISSNPSKSVKFLTIHKSKGLEADNVILLHVVEGEFGIPSQVVDDPILKYVSKSREYFPYDEERRLFYVALTRTKNKVYILSDRRCPSRFLKELSHDLKITTYNEL